MESTTLKIDFDGRRFRSVSNTPHGDVTGETQFVYHQRGDVIWATYEDGSVRFGTLVAAMDSSGCLDMRYNQVSVDGSLQTGVCLSCPELLADGRLRLHEQWQWTCGDFSEGTSVVEEITTT